MNRLLFRLVGRPYRGWGWCRDHEVGFDHPLARSVPWRHRLCNTVHSRQLRI